MDIHEITLRKQIDFNNQWPNINCVEIESTLVFKHRLKENGLKQLLFPIQLDMENAIALFENNKDISKIFSTTLDAFDVLPMHPDIAFDVVWRALEISFRYLSVNSWSYGVDKGFDQVLRKGCDDIVAPYCNSDGFVSQMFEDLLANISLVSLRYLVVRLFFKMDLSVCPQVMFVRKRADELLGKNILQSIHDKYVDDNGKMNAENQRKAARLFRLIFKGEQVDINGLILKPLELSKRVELYVSCTIYSSRCERFHGDHYSPLKSSLANLETYYEYYYLLIFSYALWGIMMNKIQNVVKGAEAFTVEAVCKSVCETLKRIKMLPNK